MFFRYCAVFQLLLVCFSQPVYASQPVEISVSNDDVSGLDIIQAETTIDNYGTSLRRTLLTIAGYAELHPWIVSSTPVESISGEGAEFLLEFKFPWPVRHRWSRIVVQQDGDNAIRWHQVEGNMQHNEGRLEFASSRNQSMEISMSAIFGIGLPEVLCRSLKKQFVKEFITAAYDQAITSSHAGLSFPQ